MTDFGMSNEDLYDVNSVLSILFDDVTGLPDPVLCWKIRVWRRRAVSPMLVVSLFTIVGLNIADIPGLIL
jgi:hypothetical protein